VPVQIEADTLEKATNRVRHSPREQDFIGRKGYRRTYSADGKKYTWRYRDTPHAVGEAMKPYWRAETERQDRKRAKQETVALRDKDGGIRRVDPSIADATARRQGWSLLPGYGGVQVERGADGMLWRRVAGQWWPTGKRCLGTPLRGRASISRGGVQHDPSGHPWRFIRGEWRP
jgi:hypothetical protein